MADFRVKVRTFSYTEDENSEKTIVETVRDEVIPNPDNRHEILCAKCGWSTYPACRKWCQGDQWWRERHPEEAAAFKKWWFENHPKDTEPFPEDK